MVVAACKEVHTLTGDTSNVDTINAWEVHLAECFTIDRRVGNDNTTANHRLLLILFSPFSLLLRTDECFNSFCVSLCTYYQYLIVHVKNGVAHRCSNFTFMQQTCTNDITIQETWDFSKSSTCDIRVGNFQAHAVSLCVWVLSLCFLKFLFFVFKVYSADVLYSYGSSDNTKHTKRVGTSVSWSNLWYVAICKYRRKGFVGSTKTWSVGNGTIQSSYHHR